MTFCRKPSGKTVPDKEGVDTVTETPQHFRKNGWSWPPHPLQFVAWFTYLLFAIIGFGILVPLLPRHWVAAGYVCMGALFTLQCIVHFMAVTIDPADENVRAKSSPGPLPVFDRTKHAHVIENMHCYICEVDVGAKSKHCSLCNKCVSNFDHHCKWLNNCVGGKNYWLFFNCLISAFLGTFLLSTISSYVFIEYFIDPTALRTDPHFTAVQNLSDVWYVFLPAAPVETQASVILGLAALVSVLGLITILLIGQLLCFHIYLLWNKLSTYEYIMHQRQKQEMKTSNMDPDAGGTPPTGRAQNESYGGSLIYTNPDVLFESPSSGSPNTESPVPVNIDHGNRDPEFDPKTSSAEQKKPKKKKKRTKSNRITPEDSNKHSSGIPDVRVLPPSLEENDAPVSPAPRAIHSPSFPSRSLPVLAPINLHPVQAAGPPAEYHSDSAESMEEIPVAQTHLGSSSMSENLFLTPRSPKDIVSECEHGPRQNHFWPVTSQKFELLPKTPSIFVSESSGRPAPNGLGESKAQNIHKTHYKKMWVAKGMEGEQVLSISNAEVLPSIYANK
ncbi:palmitoyltransferase ZDHHC1 isoform X2 [Hyla sarda]|uniref:palmitoyltransferase ZDHHC1 isoform X2 n=1 Tax=Hyla sarda TaxID=327740 RepID=UPI0024C437A5|nr:palmitoyltransferase ZDHHC1 isoform X2 [Hyla sarda]